jgi:hypothetical protein
MSGGLWRSEAVTLSNREDDKAKHWENGARIQTDRNSVERLPCNRVITLWFIGCEIPETHTATRQSIIPPRGVAMRIADLADLPIYRKPRFLDVR